MNLGENRGAVRPAEGLVDDATKVLAAEAPGILAGRKGLSSGTLVEFQGGHARGMFYLAPLFRRSLAVTDSALTFEAAQALSCSAPMLAAETILTPFPPDKDLLATIGASAATVNLLFVKGKERFPDLAQAAWYALTPEGLFLAVGHKTHAVSSIARAMEEVFGNVTKAAYGKGCSVYLSIKGRGPAPAPPSANPREPAAIAQESSLKLGVSPWVFASGQVDGGTRFLLEHSPSLTATSGRPSPSGAICDLGCGSGILGMVAAKLFGDSRVYLVDSSCSAVALAARNLAANDIRNAVAGVTSGLAFFPDRSLDLILCNPPFHQEHQADHATAESFMAGARRVLRPGGTLEIVANRFLSYERPLRAVFGDNAGLIAQDNSFKLLVARQPA